MRINNKKEMGKKKSIPHALKTEIWEKYFGKVYEHKCCLSSCSRVISSRSFDAGHIVAEINGGGTNVNNLAPICRQCNSSMGTKSMGEYEIEYGDEGGVSFWEWPMITQMAKESEEERNELSELDSDGLEKVDYEQLKNPPKSWSNYYNYKNNIEKLTEMENHAREKKKMMEKRANVYLKKPTLFQRLFRR